MARPVALWVPQRRVQFFDDSLIDDRGDGLAEKMFVVSFDNEGTLNNEETRDVAYGDVTTITDSSRDKHMAA